MVQQSQSHVTPAIAEQVPPLSTHMAQALSDVTHNEDLTAVGAVETARRIGEASGDTLSDVVLREVGKQAVAFRFKMRTPTGRAQIARNRASKHIENLRAARDAELRRQQSEAL